MRLLDSRSLLHHPLYAQHLRMPGDFIGEHPGVVDDGFQFAAYLVYISGRPIYMLVQFGIVDQLADRALELFKAWLNFSISLTSLSSLSVPRSRLSIRFHPVRPRAW